MQRAIATELEALAFVLLERKWAARVGLVTEGGEVLALASEQRANARGRKHDAARGAEHREHHERRDEAADDDAQNEPLPDGLTALVVVESVDDQRWIYADVGSVRLLARLSEPQHESEATEWLTQALRHRGISVEHEPAQRE